MNIRNQLFKWSTQIFADEIVKSVYSGILNRAPESDGLRSYANEVKNHSIEYIVADLIKSEELWNQLFKRHNRELINAAYNGLLERSAEVEVFSQRETIDSSDRLASMLREIGTSEEHWLLLLRTYSKSMVKSIFHSFFHREPDEEALGYYSSKLNTFEDLIQIICEIISSDEYYYLNQSENLVNTIYASLLNRKPDSEGLQRYVTQIRQTQEVNSVVEEISRSSEHLNAFVKVHSKSFIKLIYQGLLSREPEPTALNSYAARVNGKDDLLKIMREIGRSAEHYLKVNRASKWRHPSECYEDPAWVYIHIQKTGGTSLQNMLIESYGSENMFAEHDDTLHLHCPADLAQFDLFSGHFNFDSLAFIPRKRLNIFAFVREPKARLISLYKFLKSHKDDSNIAGPLSKLANKLTIEEFFMDDEMLDNSIVWNHMAWCIVGQRQWELWRVKLQTFGPDSTGKILEEIRNELQKRMKEYLFIGIQEKFDLSIQMLSKLMRQEFKQIRHDHSLEKLTTSNDSFKSAGKVDVTDAALDRMGRFTQLDDIVYEIARDLFDSQAFALGESLE